MAKMTINNVTYEGTPEELREIVRTFEEVEVAELAEHTTVNRKAEESLTFEGEEYTLVLRKAQVGDVVVFTENTYRHLTNGKPYEVKDRLKPGLHVDDDDDGSYAVLVRPTGNRTEGNTLVYEKVEVDVTYEYKVGDIFGYKDAREDDRIITHEVSGIIGSAIEFYDVHYSQRNSINSGSSRLSLICAAEDRVDTK